MVEKFLKDYADVKLKEVMIDKYLLKEVKKDAIRKIDNALLFREKELITRDEAISIILHCCEYLT